MPTPLQLVLPARRRRQTRGPGGAVASPMRPLAPEGPVGGVRGGGAKHPVRPRAARYVAKTVFGTIRATRGPWFTAVPNWLLSGWRGRDALDSPVSGGG
eukprot:14790873-Alexandrium_andersonii.AAC.1